MQSSPASRHLLLLRSKYSQNESWNIILLMRDLRRWWRFISWSSGLWHSIALRNVGFIPQHYTMSYGLCCWVKVK
jgi:hypothetical protein